jgi:hypothetical protein
MPGRLRRNPQQRPQSSEDRIPGRGFRLRYSSWQTHRSPVSALRLGIVGVNSQAEIIASRKRPVRWRDRALLGGEQTRGPGTICGLNSGRAMLFRWKTFSGPNPRKAYLERSAFALRLTLRSLHLDSRFCNLRYCCSAFAILGTPISGSSPRRFSPRAPLGIV